MRYWRMMKPLSWLTNPHALKYWADHAPALVKAGLLDKNTKDDFANLCEVWGELRTVDKSDSKGRIYYVSLLKQYRSMKRDFKIEAVGPDIRQVIQEALK